ncbi:unnamed protein product [Moneuplotes crassus]|uniref:Uncharacterized protein n=1 Tax=Euplotes crassus TaxID=5936 RepID=A0AAD1XAY0_EUPCR|nr:unnamed protein product [Moneuplotes crassus]
MVCTIKLYITCLNGLALIRPRKVLHPALFSIILIFDYTLQLFKRLKNEAKIILRNFRKQVTIHIKS